MIADIRVYYEDTDAGGVVHNSAYARFFERGRTEWLRHLGFEQRDIADNLGLLFAVRRLTIDYKAPARLDDLLRVATTPKKRGRSSLLVAQQLHRDETELATAEVLVVCARAAPLRPASLPQPLADALDAVINADIGGG